MKTALKLITLSFVLLGPDLLLRAQEQNPSQTPTQATPTQAAPAAATQAPSTQSTPPAVTPTQAAPAQTTPTETTSPQTTPAQATPTPSLFTSDRLEQLVAPIALYPDSLVAQILMASTYPLEIVEAARWVDQNPGLKGTALEEGLKQNEWDPSVKALCEVPTVLKKMNDNIAWTKDLGDAFLAQKVELMDTIQQMRRKALDAGSLKTTQQQTVTQDDGQIVIQQANPDVIYVPVYSPAVYGPAWYYPTYYYPGWYDPWWGWGIAFGIGFFWGSCCWGGCDWHHHCCNVHCDHFNNFNAHTSAHGVHSNFPTTAGSTSTWQHDPAHRAGVNYSSAKVAHQFGAAPGSTRVTSAQTHGSEHAGGAPSGPGSRGLSGATQSANPASKPSMARGGLASASQRSSAGPASGRMAGEPSRSSTAPTMSSRSGSYSSPRYFSGNTHTYSGSSASYRGRGVPSGYRGASPGHTSNGWGGMSHGGATTFGRGWSGTGSFSGAGRSSGGSFGGSHGFGGSFGGGHSFGGSFGGGGHGFGGGGFHGGGGGHR
jgi:hypothetical protein